MPTLNHRHKAWLLPVIVLATGYALSVAIRSSGPVVDIITPEVPPLVIRAITVQPQTVQLKVESQGEVTAQHMIKLVNEVPARVVGVTPAFVTGGYFRANDLLLQLDDTDYALAKIRAEAQLTEALEEYQLRSTEADLARQGLFPLLEARTATAEARVQSARAQLAQAEADLQRTSVRAPFDGRVLFTTVNLGQYVGKGEALGQIFSTAIAEVRLPLTDAQIGYLELPFGTGTNEVPLNTPVTLRTEAGGSLVEYSGYLHRMEGAVDPENRVWYAVARVDDPYGLQLPEPQPPLAIGLFVEAEIQGRSVENAMVVPRSALRNSNAVLIVDKDNRLRQRTVDILKTDFQSAYISAGLQPGDRVCVSPIELFVDGMLVEIEAYTADQRVAGN